MGDLIDSGSELMPALASPLPSNRNTVLRRLPGFKSGPRPTPERAARRQPLLTSGPDVDEGVVGHHQLAEVEFVGEALPFGLVQNPLVVVIPGKQQTIAKSAQGEMSLLQTSRAMPRFRGSTQAPSSY